MIYQTHLLNYSWWVFYFVCINFGLATEMKNS